MDLVERYIEAIKFWLPKHLKEDIAAELREDIHSQIEEVEREKGRKLADEEIAAILKARGAPLAVASRYLPQRWLIGPELFPVYIFVLKIVAVICFIPPVIAWMWAAFNPSQTWPGVFATPVNSLLVSFAIVTLIFAVIEHKGINPAKLANFNPMSLPPVVRHGRIQRCDSVGEIIFGLIVIGFFLAGYLSVTTYALPPSIVVTNGHVAMQHTLHGHISVSPEWIAYWQIVVVIAAAEIAFGAANLFKRQWTLPRIVVRMALDLCKATAFCWLLSSNVLREFVVQGVDANTSSTLYQISATAAQYARPIAVVLALIVIAKAIGRMIQVRYQHRTAAVA